MDRITRGEAITAKWLNRFADFKNGIRQIKCTPPLKLTIAGGGSRILISLATSFIYRLIVIGKLAEPMTSEDTPARFTRWKWDSATNEFVETKETGFVVSWLGFGDKAPFAEDTRITAVKLLGARAGEDNVPVHLLLGISCEEE
jgi:hypothetical protein